MKRLQSLLLGKFQSNVVGTFGFLSSVLLMLSLWSFSIAKENVEIIQVDKTSGELDLGINSGDRFYYVLSQSESSDGEFKVIGLFFGEELIEFQNNGVDFHNGAFFMLERISLDEVGDFDRDGLDDLFEKLNPNSFSATDPRDALADPDGNGQTAYQDYTTSFGPASTEKPEITRMSYNSQDEFELTFKSEPGHYYVLERSFDLQTFPLADDMILGFNGIATMRAPIGADLDRVFFRVVRHSVDTFIDSDSDGFDDVWELQRPLYYDPLVVDDGNEDPDMNGASKDQEYAAAQTSGTTIIASPSDGEKGVAVTRETILTFSNPLDVNAQLNTENFYATFAGERLGCRIEVGAGHQTATLFYDDILPANARITVILETDGVRDFVGRVLDGDGDGVPGGNFVTEFDTLTLTALTNTAVCGRVFASELEQAGSGDTPVNCPLAGVRITVDGREDELFAITDQFGNFRLEPAPVGRFFVHIDGRTTSSPVPEGSYYPFVGKAWESVAGTEVNVGNIYLPLIPEGTLQNVDEEETLEVTFVDSIIEDRPELEGVMLEVPPNSLFADDGQRGGRVGIAPVEPERLPGRLPDGLEFSVVITVQTDGATNFDQPVPVCFPNLPNPVTGELLQAGAKTALWSFNHDTGRFGVVGSMTVSSDGRLVCSDPGVGILAPGWHGTAPGAPGGGGDGDPSCPPDESPPEPCPDSGVGDPVRTSTGEMHLTETDLRIQGRGLDFEWTRYYASREGDLTPIGHNWDYKYNISIVPSGRLMKLRRGEANEETFHQNAEGNFERREFFFSINRNPDDTWSMTRPNREIWTFNNCDNLSSPICGKIQSIADRNGNTMRFEYDSAGRLNRIIDTLDRPIDIAYTIDGFVETVTDFTGRQVRYEYYDGIEPGGGLGDLKSCRSPIVTGTPNANDFPNGKLRSYTYSTGFSDENLNHNLLTITDGRRNDPNDLAFGNGPFVVNAYSQTTNPASIEYDRVIRQIWGGDIIDLHYEMLETDNVGQGEVQVTIVNDRMGNISEYYFDFGNRLRRKRIYTGRASASQPTDLLQNRPGAKLRASDPDFFETRWEYNEDSLLTRTIYPNGNFVDQIYQGDLQPDGDPRFRGNLLTRQRNPGPLGGDQNLLTEHFEYNDDFGCNSCGFNFVTKHTDSRGNETHSTYDENGNLIQRQHRISSIVEDFEYNQFGQLTAHIRPNNGSRYRRRDEFTYYKSGSQRGYRSSRIIDATGEALTASFEYNDRGVVVREIDPRNNDRLLIRNQLDQVVEMQSRPVVTGSTRYTQRFYYDANNNRIRVDVENRDGDGNLVAANPWFTSTFDYEILNQLVHESREITEGYTAVTEYGYDANRNLVLTRYPEAVNGKQLTNTLTRLYDERDLLFRKIEADGDPLQSTSEFAYDPNGNRIREATGIEDGARATDHLYDGYNRLIETIDPMGNVINYQYDANANPTQVLVMGERTDVAGSNANVRLYQADYEYDDFNRKTHDRVAHFDDSGANIGDGESTKVTAWSDFSQILSVTDDNGNATLYTYDTINRLLTETDAIGNQITYGYDANSNIITQTELDISDLATPDETFMTHFAYDGLDRQIRITDNLSNINDAFYDSRDNRVRTSDAMRSAPNQSGNIVRFEYDGLSRLIATHQDLTDDGTGTGTIIDTITTLQAWDDNSRLIGLTDDNGNVTRYSYDPLNRLNRETFADDTFKVFVHDAHHDRIVHIDQNGSQCVATFDTLSRLIRKDITRATGVLGVTLQTFEYDGLSRQTTATDNNNPDIASDDSQIAFEYDSLSHLIEETQNGETIASAYDGVGRRLSLTYPNGRIIEQTHDAIDRVKKISDQGAATPIGAYEYIGVNRVLERELANGTRLMHHDGAGTVTGYDGLRRETEHRTIDASDALVACYRYAYDAKHNRRYEEDMRTSTADVYQYDSIYRLTRAGYETSSASIAGITNNATTNTDVTGLGSTNQVWTLDGVGNWTQRLDTGVATFYTPNVMNEYSAIGATSVSHDNNGNLVSNGIQTYCHDHLNRLVKIQRGEELVVEYAYDANGRRIAKRFPDNSEVRFYHDRQSNIEERDKVDSTLRQYVYGIWIDEPLELKSSEDSYYYHSNSIGSVAALTDDDGSVVEHYDYDSYGVTSILAMNGSPRQISALSNPYTFTGRRLDYESGLHYFRARYFSSTNGRFIQHDPLRYIDGMGLYEYVGGNSPNYIDPLGLRRNKWKEILCLLLQLSTCDLDPEDGFDRPPRLPKKPAPEHCPKPDREQGPKSDKPDKPNKKPSTSRPPNNHPPRPEIDPRRGRPQQFRGGNFRGGGVYRGGGIGVGGPKCRRNPLCRGVF